MHIDGARPYDLAHSTQVASLMLSNALTEGQKAERIGTQLFALLQAEVTASANAPLQQLRSVGDCSSSKTLLPGGSCQEIYPYWDRPDR